MSKWLLVFSLALTLSGGAQEENGVSLNKFIRHLFSKYGSGGVMNFEGFEHLLHQIGLGNIEFSVNHTFADHLPENYSFRAWNEMEDDDGNPVGENETFHKIVFKRLHENHQHKSRHSILSRAGMSSKECLSPMSIVRLSTEKLNVSRPIKKRDLSYFEKEDPSDDFLITPEIFKEICPALIVQIDGHDCVIEEMVADTNYTKAHAWAYASASILVISLCGLFGLLVIPIAQKSWYNSFLGFLVAVAVGTLLGDALMHLLPHALMPHSHGNGHRHEESHEKEPIYLCLTALVATIFMYSLENLLPLIGGGEHSHHSHASHHQHASQTPVVSGETRKRSDKLSPVAFMVVLGDGLHNITDGLAIGAAYGVDPITGLSTALAVLCHELPHELGDFALLLRTGVSFGKACRLNILSSVLSFMGMAAGLLVSTEDTAKWIYSATAGTFMYIALSDLIPEMQKDENRTASQVVLQIAGVLLGGVIMLFIGLYEDSLRDWFLTFQCFNC